jgi:hypothetical protein
MYPRNLLLLSGILLLAIVVPCFAFGQAASSDATAPDAASIAALVAKEFGAGFKVVPGQPVLTGDFDGDGTEDIVIVTTGKNPLPDSAGYDYKVMDPYNSYFGFGDPKVTTGFVNLTTNDPMFLLVIHNWKLATPTSPAPKAGVPPVKLKFVIINIPFEKLSVGSFKVKKKVVSAITAEESGGVAAAVYWDGKNYKWKAYGAN